MKPQRRCKSSPKEMGSEAAGDQELLQPFPKRRGRWLQQWHWADCGDERQKRKME